VTGPAAAQPDRRLVVALVRGVHGLHGAVRVEILTDRPEDRYKPGAVLFREGSDEPALPHIRLDRALQFLIGDRLQ